MSAPDPRHFPIGAAVTLEQLTHEPYDVMARLRANEPVSWLPALNGWFVTRRDLAIEAMRDAAAFTVDDPRFSTAAVLGPSMLSLDGAEHERHRSPFAPAFRPKVVREQFESFLQDQAGQLVHQMQQHGGGELRTELAGPLAVVAITEFLGLLDVTPGEVLSWYTSISDAIVALTVGEEIAPDGTNAIQELRARVDATLQAAEPASLLTRIAAEGALRPEEMTSAAAVVMFGAIETSEGMTTNALWELLTDDETLDRVIADRDLVPAVIEESLRLEPAAAFIDRYTTQDVALGEVTIPAGDLVTISLLAANRDPVVFDRPNDFAIDRPNSRQHVTFVQGPHGCLGLHLARLETTVAINAVLDQMSELRFDAVRSQPVQGLIFRKPQALWVTLPDRHLTGG